MVTGMYHLPPTTPSTLPYCSTVCCYSWVGFRKRIQAAFLPFYPVLAIMLILYVKYGFLFLFFFLSFFLSLFRVLVLSCFCFFFVPDVPCYFCVLFLCLVLFFSCPCFVFLSFLVPVFSLFVLCLVLICSVVLCVVFCSVLFFFFVGGISWRMLLTLTY